VGNTTAGSAAGAHDTSRTARKNAEVIFENDMGVILPKERDEYITAPIRY